MRRSVSSFPETRYSLIARLGDDDDQEAWWEFVAIYRPAVYRIARRRGLQHADAEDLSQQVFARAKKAIARFEPDVSRGRFRSWLATIAQNATNNALVRKPRDMAVGGTGIMELLDQRLGGSVEDTEILQLELRRSLFRWAVARVQREFQESTWNAFWRTTVEGEEIASAATALSVSVGAVYAARSRVIRRLRNEIEAHEHDFECVEEDHVGPSARP
jgi:RNA polymerase sigma-70 factor (ECF subfamily)